MPHPQHGNFPHTPRNFPLKICGRLSLDGGFEKFLVHVLVLAETIGQNLGFDGNIFQPGVALLEVGVVGNETPKNFSGFLQLPIFCKITVFLAELAIHRHFTDNRVRHSHGTPDFCAVGEPVPKAATCYITLGVVEGVQVKPCVVGGYLCHPKPFHVRQHSLADFIGGCHLPPSSLEVCHVLGDFAGVVCGLHKVSFIYENIPIDKGRFRIYRAVGVDNLPPAIIYQHIGHIQLVAVLDGIGSLGIDY